MKPKVKFFSWLVIIAFSLIQVFSFSIVQALSDEQKTIYDSGVSYFDLKSCGGGEEVASISGSDLENFLKALAYQESGGDPKQPGSAGGARGKYQYIDSTWQARFSLYGPAGDYPQANLAPEPIQDAVAYLEYAQKFKELKNDLFKLAVSHFYPAANTNPSLLDVVPPSNVITPREYAQKLMSSIKHGGEWESIPLKYASAPGFDKWAKRAGVDATTASSSSGDGASADAQSQSGPVYFVGDSIGTQIEGKLSSALSAKKLKLKSNSLSSRNLSGTPPSPDGLGAIDRDKEFIKTAKNVVIELGTNSGGFTAAKVGQMVEKIRDLSSDASIYWVDTAGVERQDLARALGNVNKTINEQSSQKNFQVISWNKKVFGESANPEKINPSADDNDYIRHSDQFVHLTNKGIDAMTDLVASSIGGQGSNTNEATGCACSVDSAGSTATVNVKKIVDKYKLQSAQVSQLNGKVLGSENADSPPVTPASTMKLVIADSALQANIDTGRIMSVSSDVLYDGTNDLGVSSITIGKALEATLSRSSNVGANVLIKALGGVSEFTRKAHSYGYEHTNVLGYYSTSSRGKNKSTISDQVDAMNHIFGRQGSGYKLAQGALREAANSDNHYGVSSEANKWAGTSEVAGNVGLFDIRGKKFIIGLYYNGPQPAAPAENVIKKASEELKGLVGRNVESDDCGSSQGSGDAVGTAMDYSWEDGRKTLIMKPSYKRAIDRAHGEYIGGINYPGIDCGGFVTRAMRDSSADKQYNSYQGPTSSQQQYMEEHPEKYQKIGAVSNTGKLQPGDIAINSSHTFMYVGPTSDHPKFKGDAASASLDSYAPTANTTYFSNSNGSFTWYRLK